MALPQLDRLKSQLLTSGIQQENNALWQVINQLIDYLRQSNLELQGQIDSGGSGDGITALITDVVANGPGIAVATIQPDAVTTPKIIDDAIVTSKILDSNVTYAKIQNVTPNRILGRDNISTGPPEELAPGAGLLIQDGEVSVTANGTTPGLAHKILSETHEDSLPDDAVAGDLIYAGPGAVFTGVYYDGLLRSDTVEDFEGIRAGYMLGFNGTPLGSGNNAWGAPPPLSYITPPLARNWLAWYIIDAFLQILVIEDFEGIRAGYLGETPGNFPYITGNNGAYSGYPVETIPAPNLANPTETLWQRLPVGNSGQILQPVDGFPAWSDDLELNNAAIIGGNISSGGNISAGSGNISAGGSITGNAGVFLASVTSPLFNGNSLGVWADVAFNAGNFTANGGTTPLWTLTAPDQELFRYCYVGAGLMMVQVYLASTSVSSAAGNVTELRILIPDGKTAIGRSAQLIGGQEAGAAVFDIYVGTDPSVDNTLIFIRTFPVGSGRAFDQTPNGTFIGFSLLIRIS